MEDRRTTKIWNRKQMGKLTHMWFFLLIVESSCLRGNKKRTKTSSPIFIASFHFRNCGKPPQPPPELRLKSELNNYASLIRGQYCKPDGNNGLIKLVYGYLKLDIKYRRCPREFTEVHKYVALHMRCDSSIGEGRSLFGIKTWRPVEGVMEIKRKGQKIWNVYDVTIV